jgi:hypothetical protein
MGLETLSGESPLRLDNHRNEPSFWLAAPMSQSLVGRPTFELPGTQMSGLDVGHFRGWPEKRHPSEVRAPTSG